MVGLVKLSLGLVLMSGSTDEGALADGIPIELWCSHA
jgi:hypothetical protein